MKNDKSIRLIYNSRRVILSQMMEVFMATILSLLNDPLIFLFVILFFGSLLGNLKIKGLSLGASGVLLIGMIFGHFGLSVSPVIQNLGLSLFIIAVGLQAGPRFFRMLRTKGLIFACLSFIVVIISVITTVIVSKLFHLPASLSIGLMTGALTSTPGLAAALEATKDPLASVGYGIAYPFGVIMVIFFIQFIPKILKVDLKNDLKAHQSPIFQKDSPQLMTIRLENDMFHKKTLDELDFTNRYSIVISRIIRGERTIIATRDVVLLKNDILVAVANKKALEKFSEMVGEPCKVNLDNKDNVEVRRITVDDYQIIGKTLEQLGLRHHYGITVTRIERNGIELNQHPKMSLSRGDVLTIVSTVERLDQVEQLFTKRDLSVTHVHIFSLSLMILLGILVGMIPIYIPGLGKITLGVAGGPLFVALIISHFGNVGPIHARYYIPANNVIRDLGLALFLAGVGTNAGEGLVEVIRSQGFKLMIGGAIITIIPIFVGFYVARKVFHFSMVLSLGALSGAMTSTPGLGAVQQMIDTEDAGVAYAATYPFALISVAIAAQFLPLLL